MKRFALIFVITINATFCYGQNKRVDSIQLSKLNPPNSDSMEHLLAQHEDDTTKANLLGLLSYNYAFGQPDKSILYGKKGLELSRQLGYKEGIALCQSSLGWGLWGMGDYSQALRVALEVLQLYEELGDKEKLGYTYYFLANIYRDFGDYERALVEVRKGIEIYETLKSNSLIGYAITGSIYDLQGRGDSASYYIRKAVDLDRIFNQGKWPWLLYLQGNMYRKTKDYVSALYYYRNALRESASKDIVETYNEIALLYRETGDIDSSIFYASEGLQKWGHISYQRGLQRAAKILADNYKKLREADSAVKYLELSQTLNDSLFSQEKERIIQNMAFNEQLRQDAIVGERAKFRNQLKIYGLLALGFIFLVVALLLWRNNRHRKKAYELLQRQKQETEIQKVKVEQTLTELKSAQAQLVQSEKMASLGELTAGIAHEIQNPLNFVNNFSEVNKELVAELKSELASGNMQSANEIADNIKDNEDKINQHGKRADAIVKGMLQHSRISSGQKELTDINALADEYLRLAYHGLRAKDKSFNLKLETDFDQSIGKLYVLPQEIGRVILNLINNAFYSVSEKLKQEIEGYEPTVVISTRKIANKTEIRVKDNGTGISQKVVNKIFQPFFTTKPAGQGTGLGLSLAYDIVTKAHSGELKVETKEGKGTEFIIQLPA